MKKITELKIEKELYKYETDSDGKRIRIPYVGKISYELKLVTGLRRLSHAFIDLLIIYAIFFGVAIVLSISNSQSSDRIIPIVKFDLSFIYIGYYLIYLCYYLICEATMQKTIGKFVTQSVVVDEYGNKPTLSAILGRSICRIIPFETFPCLGERGWHDTMSETFVITETELENVRRMKNDGVYISNSSDTLD